VSVQLTIKEIIDEPSEKILIAIMKDCDTMNLTEAVQEYYMKKKQEYLDKHNHKIWQKEKDRRWYTYLDDDSKRGYSIKSRDTQENIELLVAKYYKNLEETPTFSQTFYLWNKERFKFGEISAQTFCKYETNFKRFFTHSDLLHKKIKYISAYELEMFIKTTIRDFELTNKAYADLRTIIRGVFRYAKRRSFTDFSITTFFGDLDLSRKIFKHRNINKEKEVFTEKEILKVTSYLRRNKTIRDYALLLAFQTGMRVGELAGLKKIDIKKHEIHVNRTEVNYKDPNTKERICEVRDFPKSEAGDRYLLIPKTAIDTLDVLMKLSDESSEYVFSENGRRIRANALNRRLTRVCNELGIPKRSMHKVRKTYATSLIDGHVDEATITQLMGHKDISTTMKYYYWANKDTETKQKQLDKAILC
jgi:integrase